MTDTSITAHLCTRCPYQPGELANLTDMGKHYNGLVEFIHCDTPNRAELKFHVITVQILNCGENHANVISVYSDDLRKLND